MSIIGNAQDNALVGNDKFDRINGRAGNDTISGLDGDDILLGGNGADLILGGAGKDTASFQQAKSGVVVDLQAGRGLGGEALGDIYVSIENVVASQFADVVTDGRGSNYIVTWGGADTINMRWWDYNIDSINGGAGWDTINYSKAIIQTSLGLSVDLTNGRIGDSYFHYYDKLISIENVTATQNDDFFVGNQYSNYFRGLGGNDRFNVSAGKDFYQGGAGIDQLDFGVRGDSVDASFMIDLGSGIYRSYSSSSQKAVSGHLSDIEIITGSQSSDVIIGDLNGNDLSGANGNDFIKGAAGNDTIKGDDGNDVLRGDDGDDLLTGGAGLDQLSGNTGNDTLNADFDGDTLSGGNGSDIFSFDGVLDAASVQHSVITDFEIGIDKIDLKSQGFFTRIDQLNLEDTPDGVVIHMLQAALMLQGVTATQLSDRDFIFA